VVMHEYYPSSALFFSINLIIPEAVIFYKSNRVTQILIKCFNIINILIWEPVIRIQPVTIKK